ncbi:hypothetical protein YT1_p10101 (plasmid) [Rhodococcus ruber]|nr:hypothetical protein YT1_p10101 [Rhodococcus ruber]
MGGQSGSAAPVAHTSSGPQTVAVRNAPVTTTADLDRRGGGRGHRREVHASSWRRAASRPAR